MASATHKLLIKHAKQIVTVCNEKQLFLAGKSAMNNLSILGNDKCQQTYSIVVSKAGNFEFIGTDDEVATQFKGCNFDNEIDASGMCIVPGLVDAHTHPVWVGDRVHEFAMKLAGASYMDVHKAGGGIGFTVDCVRKASEEDLYNAFLKRLISMSRSGTTLLEAKSGYGLNVDAEVKMLKVIQRAKLEFKSMDISATYCGAHSIPKGLNAAEATEDVINVQLPKIKQLIDAKELEVDNIDVFMEKGVFDGECSRKIFKAGQEIGLAVNFHGDELHPMQSAELGAEIGARAISHLEEVSDDGITKMAEKHVIGVLLPTTAYILRLKPPPAQKMIESGVPIALGTDFNPNAHCMSMPIAMHMACCILRMTMNEVLAAATINAAASVGKSSTHGSIEVGKCADMLILDAPRWEHLIYQLGGEKDTIKYVLKNGSIVHSS